MVSNRSAKIIQFSDHHAAKVGMSILPVSMDRGRDELGNQIGTMDIGPVELSVYTSQDDGSLVVQIDTPEFPVGEHPSLRVYLNDSTVYDSTTVANQKGD